MKSIRTLKDGGSMKSIRTIMEGGNEDDENLEINSFDR